MKKKFDYVMSAVNMMGMNTKHYFESQDKIDVFSAALHDMIAIVNKSLKEKQSSIDSSLSVLFNAFTEGDSVHIYEKTNNMGCDLLYADSGGLQIVTAGREITEELKDKVYNVQCKSDRAMCFDVIPLESVSLVRSKVERSNISNKVFRSENHRESGRLTGKNILRQCEVFAQNQSKAKVMVIIQGNTYDDMLMYYDEIQKQIPDELMDYIGGMALADTCMGNGELESVEMLKAGHLIAKEAHPNFTKHLHLLGVGSISRMKPVIYLSKAGFLDSFERISYDSTSHTSSLLFGKFTENGKSDPVGLYRNPKAEEKLTRIYNFFDSHISRYCTLEQFLDASFTPNTGKFTKTNLVNQAKCDSLDDFVKYSSVCFMYVYYQIHDFILQLDKAWNESKMDHTSIGKLQNVHSLKELDLWMDEISSHVNSSRIKRSDELRTLDCFFS